MRLNADAFPLLVLLLVFFRAAVAELPNDLLSFESSGVYLGQLVSIPKPPKTSIPASHTNINGKGTAVTPQVVTNSSTVFKEVMVSLYYNSLYLVFTRVYHALTHSPKTPLVC
jgi:hypothetical protein